MKKSLVLVSVLAALLLVTVMAVSVSAAPSLEMGEITVVKDIENNLVTVTVPYTATEVEQITILATKGGADAAPAETEENIVYVAQQESATASSFTFSVYYSEFEDAPYLWVKIGGTKIDTAKGDADGEEIWVTTNVLIYGDVNIDGAIDATDIVLITKYIGAKATGSELDATEFPNGTFKAGSDEVGNVTYPDTAIDATDIVVIAKYIAATSVGGTLDETEFPNGKFPAYQNN